MRRKMLTQIKTKFCKNEIIYNALLNGIFCKVNFTFQECDMVYELKMFIIKNGIICDTHNHNHFQ